MAFVFRGGEDMFKKKTIRRIKHLFQNFHVLLVLLLHRIYLLGTNFYMKKSVSTNIQNVLSRGKVTNHSRVLGTVLILAIKVLHFSLSVLSKQMAGHSTWSSMLFSLQKGQARSFRKLMPRKQPSINEEQGVGG